jgi:hypothetical protein
MSWCYGSIGNLRAMFLASCNTENKEMEDYTINELVKIAQMDTKDYLLYLPYVCHGFAGTVSIMDEMFNDTGNIIFLKTANEQLKLCIDYITNADYSYIDEEPRKRVHLYNYLEGYSGMFQTAQSFLCNIDKGHKKRLLVV